MPLGPPGPKLQSTRPGGAVEGFWLKQQYFGYTYDPILTSALPTPGAAGGEAGARAWVSDATSRTFGAAPTGSGGDIVPVWCDGVTWYIG